MGPYKAPISPMALAWPGYKAPYEGQGAMGPYKTPGAWLGLVEVETLGARLRTKKVHLGFNSDVLFLSYRSETARACLPRGSQGSYKALINSIEPLGAPEKALYMNFQHLLNAFLEGNAEEKIVRMAGRPLAALPCLVWFVGVGPGFDSGLYGRAHLKVARWSSREPWKAPRGLIRSLEGGNSIVDSFRRLLSV